MRRAQLRGRDGIILRAGVAYSRETIMPKSVYWEENIAVLLFPYLYRLSTYLNSIGVYQWTSEKCIE